MPSGFEFLTAPSPLMPVLPGWLAVVLYALVAYLVGAISFGYLVVKQLKGVDIRDHGSGNTGATNVKRVAGGKAAIVVLLLDFLKGLLVVLAAKFWVFPGVAELHVLFGIVAIIGHSKSVFLGFSGGKSAATGLGTLFGLNPFVGLIAAIVAGTIFGVTRIVSIASMTAAVVVPIVFFILNEPLPYVLFGLISGVYVIFLHRANIQRLMNGTEKKLN